MRVDRPLGRFGGAGYGREVQKWTAIRASSRKVSKRVWDQSVQGRTGTGVRIAFRTRSRSEFSPDLHTVLPADEQPPLYNKLESLLRAAVKTCLLDSRFGSRFEDDQSVLKEYP